MIHKIMVHLTINLIFNEIQFKKTMADTWSVLPKCNKQKQKNKQIKKNEKTKKPTPQNDYKVTDLTYCKTLINKDLEGVCKNTNDMLD